MSRTSLLVAAFLSLSGCQSTPAVGVSCARASDCASPLTCSFGRCRTQCVLNRDCPLGATCLLDASGQGSCGVSQDVGCDRGMACDDGLACIVDRCVAPCADASDCPGDGVCAAPSGTSTRVCFDARGGLPDASISDAGAQYDGGGSDAALLDAGAPSGPVEMCVGPHGMCVLTADRHVLCWGLGNNGRNGHGDEVDTIVAQPVLDFLTRDPLAGIDHVACGAGFGCAHVATTGAVLCWGEGSHGELGVGASTRLYADAVLDDAPPGPVVVAGGRIPPRATTCACSTRARRSSCAGETTPG